jgi:hypothetical protein
VRYSSLLGGGAGGSGRPTGSPPLSCLDGQAEQVGEDRRRQFGGDRDQGGWSGGAVAHADVALEEIADGLARQLFS